jgi:hypothetical protein
LLPGGARITAGVLERPTCVGIATTCSGDGSSGFAFGAGTQKHVSRKSRHGTHECVRYVIMRKM